MTSQIQQAYKEIQAFARDQGEKEKEEALGMLEAAAWFDNFGYSYYYSRLQAVHIIVSHLGYVPEEHERLAESAADVLETPYPWEEA